MFIRILLITLSLFFNHNQMSDRAEFTKEDVVRNMVFMRAEGLYFSEKLSNHTQNNLIKRICKRVQKYYSNTQPAFLRLCTAKELGLAEEQVLLIFSRIDSCFQEYTLDREAEFLSQIQELNTRSLSYHAHLLQNRKWEDVAIYSFQALPEIMNLQNDITNLMR